MKLRPPAVSDGLRKRTQVKFRGYNALGTEGELCHTENLTSDYYPELASRPPRRIVETLSEPRGIAGGSNYYSVDGTELSGYRMGEWTLPDRDTVRTFAQLGDYMTIWPDKKALDVKTLLLSDLEASVTGDAATDDVTMRFYSEDGEISSEANGMKFGQLSLTPAFRAGDAVTISGCTRHPANNKTVIVRKTHGIALICLDNTFELDEVITMTADAAGLAAGDYAINEKDALGYEYLCCTLPAMSEGDTLKINTVDFRAGTWTGTATVSGAPQTVQISAGSYGDPVLSFVSSLEDYAEPGAVTVSRTAPDLEHVFAHDNRLIGLAGDTVYVSKLGDPFNWNVFDGVASDSWTGQTGTPGVFTGGISYGGYPRLFKQDWIFTLYGDYPGEYELASYRQPGVYRDSARSLAIGCGRLFYLSAEGPCVYAGREPVRIADAFGVDKYHAGVGGADDRRYYLSVKDGDGDSHLFAYDIRNGLWMREDGTEALAMCNYLGSVLCLAADGTVSALGRPRWPESNYEDEGDIAWVAEFGDIALSSPDRKRVTKVQLRLDMEPGSTAAVWIRYDGETAWQLVSELTARRKRSAALPIVPRRLDRLRLKLEGEGPCRISSLSIEYAPNSDR